MSAMFNRGFQLQSKIFIVGNECKVLIFCHVDLKYALVAVSGGHKAEIPFICAVAKPVI